MEKTAYEASDSHSMPLDQERMNDFATILPEALSQVPKVQTLRTIEKPEDAKKWADFWFTLISQCQQTEGFSGHLRNSHGESEFHRGTDYMYLAAQRMLEKKGDYFSPENIQNISPEEYCLWYTDNHGHFGAKDEKIDERYNLMRETVSELKRKYGDFLELVKTANNRLAGEGGVFARLKEVGAYKDEEEKKSRLLTMFLSQIGAVSFDDPENLQCPVDYHIVRVLLRTGIIDLSGAPELKDKLTSQSSCTKEEDNGIRRSANQAIKELSKLSGLSMFDLNHLFWSLGRMYCFRDKDKLGVIPECVHFTCADLLTQEKTDNPYRIGDEMKKRLVPDCPVHNVCIGKRTEIKNLLHEPYIFTPNY